MKKAVFFLCLLLSPAQQFPAEQKDARFPEKTAACTAGGSQVFGGKW